MFRAIAASFCAAALFILTAPAGADAQGPLDKRTYFTFSHPIALPGVTLKAGTYMFRIANPTGGRKIVQVLSEDGANSYAMLHAIPVHRADAPDDPEIHFMETPASTPAAVKIWWYPGEKTGHEFIYPEEQAMLLAKGGREPVLMAHTAGASREELDGVELAHLSPTGEEIPVAGEDTPVPVTPVGPVEHGSLVPPAAPGLTAVGTSGAMLTRTELPQTASLMPLAAATGALSFAGGALLWLRRRSRPR